MLPLQHFTVRVLPPTAKSGQDQSPGVTVASSAAVLPEDRYNSPARIVEDNRRDCIAKLTLRLSV